MINISTLAKKNGISNKYLELYGKYMAKVKLDVCNNTNKKNSNLILITSINPTKYGEGKTTLAIGLVDGLCRLGKKATACLREPSLGPVFGIKGGATGGGKAIILPQNEINLHFTGDMHAISACDNLLCAIVDNHIFQGNDLDIQKVCITRTLDVNDRALRNITINSSYQRHEEFKITAASEIMAILTIAKDFADLKKRLGKIIVGYNSKSEPIFASDLQAVDALAILLKDAIKPNIVQTNEKNLVFVHGGPFANISFGTCSTISLNLGLKLFDYCVTEAGFGSDLGGEKFFDIVAPNLPVKPSLVVINVTIRSLKHHGGCSEEDMHKLNLNYLDTGLKNLDFHINNMLQFSNNVIVAINKFKDDTKEEIEYVINHCQKLHIDAILTDAYQNGGKGTLDLAKAVVNYCNKKNIVKTIYKNNDKLKEKIDLVAKKAYHAKNVIYNSDILKKINELDKYKYPICIAKTPFSISDNPKLIGYPKDFTMTVTDIYLENGAGVIVVLMGNILTMPGLGKNNAYLRMQIDDNGNVGRLF